VTADFADVLSANTEYADTFDLAGLPPAASRGLAVVTCMDSRIEPLRMLGLEPGDAKILRNAGARVTEDVLRTLVVATHFLNVSRVMVVPHTECKMTQVTETDIHQDLAADGIDARSLQFGTVADQEAALLADVQAIRSWPFLPDSLAVGGFRYDVDTGLLTQVC